MASITPSSIISEIRGSVGTQTYSRNTYGPYVKLRKTPINPATAPQIASRARLTAAVLAWKNLTQAQRDRYIVLAREYSNQSRIGEAFMMTGYNFFIRQYMDYNLILGGGPTTGQAHKTISTIKIVFINPSAAAFGMTVNNKTVITGQSFIIYSTGFRPASRISFNPSKGRIVLSGGSIGGDVPLNIKAPTEAIFGAMNTHIGERMTLGARTVNTVTGEHFETTWESFIIAA